jgi:isopenicillin N synthase-like dioxygenase
MSEAVKYSTDKLPVINIGPLLHKTDEKQRVADEIGEACRKFGFFYICGHEVREDLQANIEQLSKQFFALDTETKMSIRMELAGRAWRGYFPTGGELTSGKPDQKEGIYFGEELSKDHPLVKAETPVHGPNLFPSIAGFKETVLDYMNAQTQVGHSLMRGLALSLNLPESYFADRYTANPLILFRIFNYPYDVRYADGAPTARWGVGEHTDYGLLTILKQDDAGGLEVKSDGGWITAPPMAGTFVCNIGDMLDRMTKGLYRSTPHRVRSIAKRDRLSFPFFFDPNFNAEVAPIDEVEVDFHDDRHSRWDRASVHEISGTYGDYLLKKVSKVFPELRKTALEPKW